MLKRFKKGQWVCQALLTTSTGYFRASRYILLLAFHCNWFFGSVGVFASRATYSYNTLTISTSILVAREHNYFVGHESEVIWTFSEKIMTLEIS